MKHLYFILALIISLPVFAKNNLHLIDQTPNGFAIYRASEPDAQDMKAFCDLGITEMMVLSGTAEEGEYRYQAQCPSLKVIYNVKQSAKVPLERNFIEGFDAWVASSQAAGKRIAFRCECGCHRTGRLAAYYEMKYKGLGLQEALKNMNKYGKYMFLFPQLPPQVQSLEDYIQGETCSVEERYCVGGN